MNARLARLVVLAMAALFSLTLLGCAKQEVAPKHTEVKREKANK